MVGETVSRYRVIARLGSGSMGDVYRAEDTRLLRPVALKFVKLSGDEAAASRRLLAEARAASALSHPNIAVVYEVDEVDRDGGRRASSRWSTSPGGRWPRSRRPDRFRSTRSWISAAKSPARSRRRTRGASCTATSSRRTSWSPGTAG